ncbi:MAG: PepSY-associated TM helix domain-containing protein [Bacteroidota bacterium]
MTIKKAIGKIHLWLGLSSGLVVVFLGLTGCILAFQREIETVTKPYQYVRPEGAATVSPSRMLEIATRLLPGKVAHSVTYGTADKAAVITYYHDKPAYYYLAYIDPYTGAVLRLNDMSEDFFRVVLDGHFYLWLPPDIGKPIVASATLIFLVMMITGIVLWWPRNKAARKQRFTIKLNARWRRKNYDLHNVLGFYMSWVVIFIAITGLAWGFQWAAASVYWATSGGKKAVAFYEPVSHRGNGTKQELPMVDRVWQKMNAEYPHAETIEIHYPETDTSVIAAGANPDVSTYWKADHRYFDQYSMKELSVTHMYGRLKDTKAADKIARMNYDIHVGAVLGLPGKIMAFFASLLAASLPVTGFLIWRGRRRKKNPLLP